MSEYLERIDKILSSSGLLTRREAKKAAQMRRITVDGKVERDTSLRVSDKNILCLDGKRVVYSGFTYLMMNKPAGYVCSTDDPKSPIVNELLSEEYIRKKLFSVGRLDKYTTGLIILTDDGVFAHNMLAPKKHVEKTYYLTCLSPIGDAEVQSCLLGIDIGGYTTKSARLEPLGEFEAYITITEGKYHQIKRMFESMGNKIKSLKRVNFGGIKLDESLKEGDFRVLTDEELLTLKNRFR